MRHMRHINGAVLAAIVATVAAPTAAQAQDAAAMAQVANQVTIIVNGATYGTSGVTLTPAQIQMIRTALSGVISGAIASGLTLEQVLAATSAGLAASEVGAWTLEISKALGIMVHDMYLAAIGIQIPIAPIWIMMIPEGGYGEIGWDTAPEMAHLWLPQYPDYPDDYEHEDEGGGGGGSYSGGSWEGDGEGDQPRTRWDSSQHEDGYWTVRGCFPSLPQRGHYLTDMMTPCTGHEVDAQTISARVFGLVDVIAVEVVPLDSESVLLLPLPGEPGIPTVVHWF